MLGCLKISIKVTRTLCIANSGLGIRWKHYIQNAKHKTSPKASEDSHQRLTQGLFILRADISG